jgi:3-deoxy-D-manno-octulosonate 8-phosphate phosphatase (KDO 8-P phosphatase)
VDVVKQTKITRKAWARVRLFAMDVDGILTDGTISICSDGTETKHFSIIGRPSAATTLRATELKIPHVIQGRHDKLAALSGLSAELGISLRDCAYMGDDVVDAPAIEAAGIGISVPTALPEALAAADYVTRRLPGFGAVREVCDLLLDARKGISGTGGKTELP